MKRFTEYRKPTDNYYLKGTNSAMVCFNGSNACEKLGKLEDLEEKIGMSLENFYKCITHNNEFYYVIDENEEGILEIREVYINDGYMHNYCSDVENRNGYFYFNGEDENYCEHNTPFNLYGETMFLTCEEAEKKLEELKNGK